MDVKGSRQKQRRTEVIVVLDTGRRAGLGLVKVTAAAVRRVARVAVEVSRAGGVAADDLAVAVLLLELSRACRAR